VKFCACKESVAPACRIEIKGTHIQVFSDIYDKYCYLSCHVVITGICIICLYTYAIRFSFFTVIMGVLTHMHAQSTGFIAASQVIGLITTCSMHSCKFSDCFGHAGPSSGIYDDSHKLLCYTIVLCSL
jgi:hypothetical protein